jgi:hypothetical protein
MADRIKRPPAATPATRRKKTKKRATQLKTRFQAVHVKGMDALKRHDYNALGKAISEERNILQAQADLIDEQRKTAAAFARRLSATIRSTRGTKAKAKKNKRR